MGRVAPSRTARLTEVALQTSALFREPTGHWGAWIGLAYAVPLQHEGMDPTTALPIDPQERLDFHLGTVLSLVRDWDLFADFAVIDRLARAPRPRDRRVARPWGVFLPGGGYPRTRFDSLTT